MDLLKSARIGQDEKIDEDEGLSETQLKTKKEKMDARARAHVLEMVRFDAFQLIGQNYLDRRSARRR